MDRSAAARRLNRACSNPVRTRGEFGGVACFCLVLHIRRRSARHVAHRKFFIHRLCAALGASVEKKVFGSNRRLLRALYQTGAAPRCLAVEPRGPSVYLRRVAEGSVTDALPAGPPRRIAGHRTFHCPPRAPLSRPRPPEPSGGPGDRYGRTWGRRRPVVAFGGPGLNRGAALITGTSPAHRCARPPVCAARPLCGQTPAAVPRTAAAVSAAAARRTGAPRRCPLEDPV